MKMLTGLIAASLLSASAFSYAGMGMGGTGMGSGMMGSGMGQGSNGQMMQMHGGSTSNHVMDMMQDAGTRSMMMDQIARDPEMRLEMLRKMMHAMDTQSYPDLQQIANQPETRAGLEKQVELMQGMLGSGDEDRETRADIMNDPKMRGDMRLQLMCNQLMTQGDMQGMGVNGSHSR